ncbi:MAG: hypothetical protein ACD_62C00587G0008 [uncultured bacterium]|nr:MAG: hypothetical protein ACD_62C00587G0008 [uncultured bacterium]
MRQNLLDSSTLFADQTIFYSPQTTLFTGNLRKIQNGVDHTHIVRMVKDHMVIGVHAENMRPELDLLFKPFGNCEILCRRAQRLGRFKTTLNDLLCGRNIILGYLLKPLCQIRLGQCVCLGLIGELVMLEIIQKLL